MIATKEEREFQLRLIAAFVGVASLLLYGIYWVCEIRYAFWGETAEAVVTGYEDVYYSNGVRASVVDIDYQYFDEGAKAVCQGSYRLYPPAVMPAVGETFIVQYVPNDAKSSMRRDAMSPSPLWASAPLFVLAGLGVLWVGCRNWLR